jgi:hypothetical protein
MLGMPKGIHIVPALIVHQFEHYYELVYLEPRKTLAW